MGFFPVTLRSTTAQRIVRSGPGLSYPEVGRIPSNTQPPVEVKLGFDDAAFSDDGQYLWRCFNDPLIGVVWFAWANSGSHPATSNWFEVDSAQDANSTMAEYVMPLEVMLTPADREELKQWLNWLAESPRTTASVSSALITLSSAIDSIIEEK